MRRRRSWTVVSALACVVATGACGQPEAAHAAFRDPVERLPAHGSAPAVLRIGISPGTGMASSTERALPLREYLAHAMRTRVELAAAHSYDELLALLERGAIDAAVLSPLTYVRARGRMPVVPLAAASIDGARTFGGYFVVHEASPHQTLEELRGKAIAWVDSTSTSGYLYPRALLRDRGFDPDRFFGRVVFAGDHWSAIRMVARREVDVATVASSFVDPGRTERIPEADELRVVAKTARIPFDCVVVLDRMPQAYARRLRSALLRLQASTAVSARLAATWGFSAFVPANEGGYDIVEDIHRAESELTQAAADPSSAPRR